MKKYLLKRLPQNLLLIIIILLAGSTKVISAYFTGISFNSLLKYDFKHFFIFLMLSLTMFVFYLLLSVVIKIPYENKVIQKMIIDIREDITNKIANSSYKEYHKNGSSTFVSWLTNDLLIIEQKGFSSFYSLFTMISETILALIGLLFFHWSIILFCLISGVVTILLPMLVNSKVNNAALNYSKGFEKFSITASSVLKGFDTLFSFNKLKNIKLEIHKASEKLAEKSQKLRIWVMISALLGASGNVISQIGVVALTGFLAFQKIVSFGSLLTIEALSNTIFNSLGNSINIFITLNTVKPIFKKFDDLQVFNDNNLKLEENISKVTLNDLSYDYEGKKVLREISYTFNKGKKYAIVGKSGSGKTTLLNILAGKLLDYSGSIKFNDYELNRLNNHSIRDKVLYLEQTPYIFTSSIRENITLGDKFSDEEIIKVLKKVDLDIFKSLDDVIEESGRNLSGGQKQRISIARALIRNINIILLDESTSNQDENTALQIENLVLDNKDLTVIMVTHHLKEENKVKLDDIIEIKNI